MESVFPGCTTSKRTPWRALSRQPGLFVYREPRVRDDGGPQGAEAGRSTSVWCTRRGAPRFRNATDRYQTALAGRGLMSSPG